MAKAAKLLIPQDIDLGDSDLTTAVPGAAKPTPAFHERPPASAPGQVRGVKAASVAGTYYLRPADHRRLRMLAAERGTAIQQLLMDAIDEVFARAGQPPVERWDTRRKIRE